MNDDLYTLGVHIGHDRSVSIVKNGVLDAHIAQERIDRTKHSDSHHIPFDAIDRLLAFRGIDSEQIAAVGISYVDFPIEKYLPHLQDQIRENSNLKEVQLIPTTHHWAHALSTYYTSGFEDALIFVADSAGEPVLNQVEAESAFSAEGDNLTLVDRRLQDRSPDINRSPFFYMYDLMGEGFRAKQLSLGKKYEQFTYLVDFDLYQDGKTMGLASYGESLLDVKSSKFDGLDFSLTGADLMEDLENLRKAAGLSQLQFVKRERANIAATIQSFLEHVTISVLRRLRDIYGHRNLCLAGGIFLNCVANHKIIQKCGFERVHILPAAGDDGQAVGAAFHAYRTLGDNVPIRKRRLSHAYYGLSYSSRLIEAVLSKHQLRHRKPTHKDLLKRIAKNLADGSVVAIVRGRSEMGPRALCHRSILADPRYSSVKSWLNEHVKFRESFRPYAPVVTWEDQLKYFDLEQDSPFMLLAGTVKEKYRRKLGAVTHVDSTARVQALTRESDDFIYDLLREFESLTSFPILLNTSFNRAGQPIVESPDDAVETFLLSNIDLLVIEQYLIEKPSQTSSFRPEYSRRLGNL